MSGYSRDAVWRPQRVVEVDGEIESRELDGVEFAFTHDGLLFACYLALRPGADRLIVMPNTWINRPSETPPVFGNIGVREHLDGHVLSVSDPTLFLSDSLVSTLFVGRPDADPIAGLVAISERIAHGLELSSDRVVFYGLSGSAYPAIRAAATYPNGRALVVNPIVRLANYVGTHSFREFLDLFGRGATLFDVLCDFPARVSPIAAIRLARREGRRPRIAVLQDIDDTDCYRNHFPMLCESFGIDLGGGHDASGQIRASAVSWNGGHMDGPQIWARIAEIDLPWLLCS
jgi:hypothetical protein